jgi:hypothetical protein
MHAPFFYHEDYFSCVTSLRGYVHSWRQLNLSIKILCTPAEPASVGCVWNLRTALKILNLSI